MRFKFNKVILFIVVVCIMVSSFIGCASSDKVDDAVIETTKATEETVAIKTTDATEVEIEESTELPTEHIEDEVEEGINKDINNNYNDAHNKDTNVIEPTYVEETEDTINTDENSNETEINLVSMGIFKLTAYCSCSRCCGKSDGITATGTVATQGRTIAVDPNVIPYGTEVVINGNTYIAEDCGGSVKSNKIDIFFDSHQDALNFGVQYADVYIKE